MNDILNRQLLSVTGLVQLEKRIRHAATVEEFGFLVVNETHALVRYRQAILWRRTPGGGGKVAAISGLALPDANAPFMVWLADLLRHLEGREGIEAIDASGVPPGEGGEWGEWLPPHALRIPLHDFGGEAGSKIGDRNLGCLFLVRDEPWTDHDRHLMAYLADSYAHSWAALLARRRPDRLSWLHRRKGKLGLLALAVAVGLCWLPVRQSVLAPAEVIPREPVVVRASIDGVVDRFEVRPNQIVAEGQVLLALDAARLQNRLDVARKAHEVSEAEYRQAAQQAVFDPRSKTSLAILQGRMEQNAAEVVYLEGLSQRIEIRAPRGGIVIFDDVNDWIGKPVTIGERILIVADPGEAEIEIHLPVADAIALERDSEVTLFLNVDPQHPIDGALSFASYQANPTPEGGLAYRLKADFAEGVTPPRIGMKGIAKVRGEETTLFYYVMRRPLAALRQRIGL
ncbi:multidrug transporter [Skermanella stibiiresistens SB22]|uniref:Multidrug transporter n=1 Tax=Skermanella stibiiresistens SB22 TaxID=1385369 RepID=W9H5F7_9PROT|nr:HlyD family efflux transporter periplasmic adaptor subunit [Skermanella stibiiresistens]EWY39937.1 multidrug transporter [Skermanella stibiiresistens SB22]